MNAYALGCTDEGLKKELLNLTDTGIEIEGLRACGGSTSLKYKVFSEEVIFLTRSRISKLYNFILQFSDQSLV